MALTLPQLAQRDRYPGSPSSLSSVLGGDEGGAAAVGIAPGLAILSAPSIAKPDPLFLAPGSPASDYGSPHRTRWAS